MITTILIRTSCCNKKKSSNWLLTKKAIKKWRYKMDYILYYRITTLIKNSPRLILVPSNNFETMEKVAAKKPSYNARLIELIFNWTKILSLEINIFDLKMLAKSGLEFFILRFTESLQRYLLTCQANSAFLGRLFCTGQQQLWRGSLNFKIFFRPLFTIIFKSKMLISRLKILVHI